MAVILGQIVYIIYFGEISVVTLRCNVEIWKRITHYPENKRKNNTTLPLSCQCSVKFSGCCSFFRLTKTPAFGHRAVAIAVVQRPVGSPLPGWDHMYVQYEETLGWGHRKRPYEETSRKKPYVKTSYRYSYLRWLGTKWCSRTLIKLNNN